MKYDFLYSKDGKTTTYFLDEKECLSIKGNVNRYFRIENDVMNASDYKELTKKYEIKILDKNTKLMELKLSRIRVIHCVVLDNTFVFLGTFIKKSQKTPLEIIRKNNERMKRYKVQMEGEQDGKDIRKDA